MFNIGTDLDTSLNFRVYKLSYAWSFHQDQNWDVALSIGAHAMDVGLSVRGEVLGTHNLERETSEQVFPLPVVGLYASRKLTERLVLNLDIEYFGVEIDEVAGSFVDAEASLDWYFNDRVGISLV